MTGRPDQHHRRSIRLQGHSYSQGGVYFVTLCTQGSLPLLGRVEDGEMLLSAAGLALEKDWLALPVRFPHMLLDHHGFMPDHLHAIILLGEDIQFTQNPVDAAGRRDWARPKSDEKRPKGTEIGSLGRVIQAYKSISTHTYIQGVRKDGWPPFERRLWQRNYHERIVRNEQELLAIRRYIDDNPRTFAQSEH